MDGRAGLEFIFGVPATGFGGPGDSTEGVVCEQQDQDEYFHKQVLPREVLLGPESHELRDEPRGGSISL